MKRLLLIVMGVLLCTPLYSDMNPYIYGVTVASAPAGFCSGSSLFCDDFEGSDVTWDTENSITADCTGYDDGEYCDDDTTTYKNGSEALGMQGATTSFLTKALSSTSSEFYIECWVRMSYTGVASSLMSILNSGGYDFTQMSQSYGTLRIIHKGSASTNTIFTSFAANTWYHIGYYYKQETGTNDGISRVWMNTDGGTFDAADIVLNSTEQDTGTSGEQGSGASIKFACVGSTTSVFRDDVRVVSGAPEWAYE